MEFLLVITLTLVVAVYAIELATCTVSEAYSWEWFAHLITFLGFGAADAVIITGLLGGPGGGIHGVLCRDLFLIGFVGQVLHLFLRPWGR